jgi:hypothetical protein
MLKGIRHEFVRWLDRKADKDGAVLSVENGWFVQDKQVVSEQVRFRVLPATAEGQAIDVDLVWTPIEKPVTLRGAEGKSYGGLTLRFAPRKGETIITTRDGVTPKDLPITRLPWADLTAQFAGALAKSGAAIFVDPSHPNYAPEWLTRHYGVLCVGWPGVNEQTFSVGQPIHCRYRVWIHRDVVAAATLQKIYENYSRSASAQSLRATLESNRVTVTIEGKPFTDYMFRGDEKYPYFYPVLGPHSGKTITEKRLPNYPHHSSIFFGCDKVNGGDYWQEGLERGRIISKNIRVVRDSGNAVVFEQQCDWERPGAESPFSDSRIIKISAPSPNLRYIDFEIKLTAKIKVRIEKTNHSLFSVRMAPDLCAPNGGVLMNAEGDVNEKGTFAKQSPWAGFHGTRNGEVEGATILCHPSNKWFPCEWFTRDYGFMSPTPLFWPKNGVTEFQPGEATTLRYRVLIYSGNLSREQLQREFDQWSKS